MLGGPRIATGETVEEAKYHPSGTDYRSENDALHQNGREEAAFQSAEYCLEAPEQQPERGARNHTAQHPFANGSRY
jgi:hypothetical protein